MEMYFILIALVVVLAIVGAVAFLVAEERYIDQMMEADVEWHENYTS